MGKLIDLTGQRFGKLLVIKRAPDNRWKQSQWVCRCDCGNQHVTVARALRSGATRSCKCGWRVHGHANARWRGHRSIPGRLWTQIERGARMRGHALSITIEQAWAQFEKQRGACALSGIVLAFASTARSTSATQTASLDRIDSARGYEPGNVQWVHKSIQLMKNTLPQDTFVEWCRAVAKTQSEAST